MTNITEQRLEDGKKSNRHINFARKYTPIIEKILKVVTFLLGIGLIVWGIYMTLLSSLFHNFNPFLISVFLCGILLIISSLLINDGNYKWPPIILLFGFIILIVHGAIVFRNYYEITFCICATISPLSFIVLAVLLYYASKDDDK